MINFLSPGSFAEDSAPYAHCPTSSASDATAKSAKATRAPPTGNELCRSLRYRHNQNYFNYIGVHNSVKKYLAKPYNTKNHVSFIAATRQRGTRSLCLHAQVLIRARGKKVFYIVLPEVIKLNSQSLITISQPRVHLS